MLKVPVRIRVFEEDAGAKMWRQSISDGRDGALLNVILDLAAATGDANWI